MFVGILLRDLARDFGVSLNACAIARFSKLARARTKNYREPPYGHSPVLHCASLLPTLLRAISARTLENGGFFFTAGPRQRGKSSFSRKRVR